MFVWVCLCLQFLVEPACNHTLRRLMRKHVPIYSTLFYLCTTSHNLCMHRSVYLSIYLPIYLSIYLIIYLCIYLSSCYCSYLSVYLPTDRPTYLPPACLPTYLPTYLSIYPSSHTGIHTDIHKHISTHYIVDMTQLRQSLPKSAVHAPKDAQKQKTLSYSFGIRSGEQSAIRVLDTGVDHEQSA